MSSDRWRNACLVLGAIGCFLAWRECRRAPIRVADPAECAKLSAQPRTRPPSSSWSSDTTPSVGAGTRAQADGTGFHLYGFKVSVPGWAMAMAPQPGEDLRAYRDRMLPIAAATVAPHRVRVARSRDNFAEVAGLDDRQKALLETTTTEAAQAIQDRLFSAFLSGEFAPSAFKPMAGVTVVRDVLDLIDKANTKFAGSLRDDQREKLTGHPFDFADYLVFSTKWEDIIGAL